jgi:hypothetical protein
MRRPVQIVLVTALLAGTLVASERFLKPTSPLSDIARRRDFQIVGIPATPPPGGQNTRRPAAAEAQRLGWLNRRHGWLASLAKKVLTVELLIMPVVVGVMAAGLAVHLRRRSAATRDG